MDYLKWILFNGLIGFVIYDGTIGVTEFSSHSANLIPFIAGTLLILSIVLLPVIFLMYTFTDDMDSETLINLRVKLSKTPKLMKGMSFIFVIAVTFLMASHGFTGSAFCYLLAYVLNKLNGHIKNMLIDELEGMELARQ